MRKPCRSLALIAALGVTGGGVAGAEERTVTVSVQSVVEIAPGFLQG